MRFTYCDCDRETCRKSFNRAVAERGVGRVGFARYGNQQRSRTGDDHGRGRVAEQTSGKAQRRSQPIGRGVAEEHPPGKLCGDVQKASVQRHGSGQTNLGGRAGGSPGDPEAGASQTHSCVRE